MTYLLVRTRLPWGQYIVKRDTFKIMFSYDDPDSAEKARAEWQEEDLRDFEINYRAYLKKCSTGPLNNTRPLTDKEMDKCLANEISKEISESNFSIIEVPKGQNYVTS